MESKNKTWISNNLTRISSFNDTVQFIGGIYLMIIMVLGIVLNSLLLLVFIRFKRTRTALNNVIFAMTAINLFGCTQFPFVIYSHFVHKYDRKSFSIFQSKFYLNFCSNRWIFSHWVCISSGFTMYFVGSSQVYLMCVISLLRYYMVKERVIESSIPMIYVKYSIGFCIMLSLFWSSMPIVGWNYYSLEGTINFFSKTIIY